MQTDELCSGEGEQAGWDGLGQQRWWDDHVAMNQFSVLTNCHQPGNFNNSNYYLYAPREADANLKH